jgi:hypothetical protein
VGYAVSVRNKGLGCFNEAESAGGEMMLEELRRRLFPSLSPEYRPIVAKPRKSVPGESGLVVFALFYFAVWMGGLYLLVRFIHWAWTN